VSAVRSLPAATGGEREQLRSWLEFHRATIARKLDALSATPVP